MAFVQDVGEAIGGPVIGGAFRASAAGKRKKEAEQGLKELGEVKYTATPQLTGYYADALREKSNPSGLTSQELALGNNRIASGTANILQHGREVAGGGVAQALNAAINSSYMGGRNQLAENDAQRRLANQQGAYGRLGNAVNQFQNIDNSNTGLKVQTQQAYGKAIQDARMEKQQHLAKIGTDIAATAGMLVGMPGVGGGIVPGAIPTPGATTSATNPSMNFTVPNTTIPDGNVMNAYNPNQTPGFKRPLSWYNRFGNPSMYDSQASQTMLYNQ